MATISTRPIIDELIRNNGYSADDPRVAVIVEYESGYDGRTVWGVTWITESKERQMRYLIPTEYVQNPRIIWSCVPYAVIQTNP